MRALGRWVILMISVSVLASLAFAQFDVGQISGTVYDQTGAVVPRATVKIRNVGTEQATTLETDSAGHYSAPSLPHGRYVISGSASGFGTATSPEVALDVGASVDVDLKLPLASRSQQVTVTGTTETVQTASQVVGNALATSQVQNLPLNGRDITDLIALAPGAVTTGQFGQTSLNGQETSFTGVNMLLDGADATRIDTNATSTQFGRSNPRISRASVDSISEVEILQTGYNAEYGRSIGAVVNFVTKSGTNEFHGGLFEYLRNDALNARNFFEYTPKKQPFKLNQFGGNVGGPIAKDKLFFFTNYEGIRQGITNSFQTMILSAQERAKFVPSMKPVVDHLAALPASPVVVPGTGGNLDYYSANLVNRDREDTGSVKIDYIRSAKDRFSARYNINDSLTLDPFGVNVGQIAHAPARSQLLRLDETHIFSPTLLNDFGVAVNRVVTDSSGGGDGLPLFSVVFANAGALPGPALFDVLSPQTSFQFLESVTKTSGPHTLKFGADIRRNRTNRELRQQDSISYLGLPNFENNIASQVTRLGYPMIGVRNTNWDLYAQDGWKASRKLTLNLGVRYEYNTVLREVHNRLSNFDIATQQLVPGATPPYQPDRNNFAPRIGFSYDPFGTGKTVVRGYGGIFYLPFLTGALLSLPGNNFPNQTDNTPPLSFPEPAVLPPGTVSNVQAFDPHSRDSYSEQWGINVQHELFSQTVLQVGYVGNHGLKLSAGAAFAGVQLNQLDPVTQKRPFPNWGDERLLGNFLASDYNAFQAQLRRRAAHFTFDVNYTWAHTIDNTVNIFNGFEDSRNINRDHGNGDTDVRHNLTADVLYDLPNLHSSSHIANAVLGGWLASSILQARSGLPVNVLEQVPSFFSTSFQRPDYVSGQSIQGANSHPPDGQLNPAAFTPAKNFDGTLARNAAKGPSFAQWDFSLEKNFQFHERYRFQFRTDFFNMLNHPNFANPDAGLCNSIDTSGACVANSDFGHSNSTINNLLGVGTSRQVQFALKLLF